MRSCINRISQSAHTARLFQLEIFWPTLESIYELRQQALQLDSEENDILRCMIDQRSMVDISETLARQQKIALTRTDILAEVERKWTLIHAGCQFIAMLLNEGQDSLEPELTPDTVYATLVRGEALHLEGFEVN